MAGNRAEWLLTTVNAVREIVANRLSRHELDQQTEREMQMALELIETIWQELVGQAGLAEREHERFEEFFEFAPDAFAVTDVGGNLREANRALAGSQDALPGSDARLAIQAVGPRINAWFDRPWAPGEKRETALVVIGESPVDHEAIRRSLTRASRAAA